MGKIIDFNSRKNVSHELTEDELALQEVVKFKDQLIQAGFTDQEAMQIILQMINKGDKK